MQRITYIFVLLVLFLVHIMINGCAAGGNKSISQNNDTDTTHYHSTPSVGTVIVTAEILSYSEDNGYTYISLKILEVEEYGASVAPLPPGTVIKAEVSQSSIKNNKIPKSKLLESGTKHKIIMNHIQTPFAAKGPAWRIISID